MLFLRIIVHYITSKNQVELGQEKFGGQMMNSKERILAALNHQTPDRVPATLEGVTETWDRLKKHYSVGTDEEVMNILEIDTRIMQIPPYIGPKLKTFTSETGSKIYTHPFGHRYEKVWNSIEYNDFTVHHPLKDIKTIEQFNAYHDWPNPDHYDYEAVKRFCDTHSDKAIRIGWPGPYQTFLELFPAEEFYMLMALNPELVHALLDRWNEFILEMYERMFIAGDGAIDFLRCCDDYGTQLSLLFSPAMWDEYFAENTKKIVQLSHKYNAKYMQHSCGAIRSIIPNLIDCGVDALEPLQKVVGMEPDGLKKDFGKDICFQGGVDTQHLLPFGTPEEVKAEAESLIKTLNVNGGYILGPSQTFEADIPVENIIAVYDARNKFR